jgi:glycosyltransferase involved in cell wall biosynthesis
MSSNKPTCVFYGAVDTYSGYGARGRDIAKALIDIKGEEWDIKIISCRWGNTPQGFIEDNPEWSFLNEHILPSPQLTYKPDFFFMNTIPSEFQAIGSFNCGITAGIESTIAPSDWVEGCQRMDLVLGSSKHTIDVLRSSKFHKVDKNTNQNIGLIEWTKPGSTLLEGVNLNTYKVTDVDPAEFNLDTIPEKFCYLFNSMWVGNAPIGEDRKNVGLLIKLFLELFKNKKNTPALILKTSTVSASYTDREEILKRINAIKKTVTANTLPNIYLLHGEFTDGEINNLYNHPKVKCMVSLTKGEGWGRTLCEFSSINKPIITAGWSGQLDYLKPEFTALLGGQLTPIHSSAANNMLLKEASWFSADVQQASNVILDMFDNYKKYAELAKRQGYHTRNNFSFENMKNKLKSILNAIPTPVKQVQLTLPTLPKLKKIEQ